MTKDFYVNTEIAISDVCIPYSKRACLRASSQLNLQIGNDFIGNYDIKGCHSKDERAFFGIGGNRFDHQISLIDPYFRPNGFDCGNIPSECY